MTDEVWKTISWAPRYEISDKGNVKSLKTGKLLKHCLSNTGYFLVCLVPGGGQKPKTGYIHRLLAEAFLPKTREDQTCINHKNFDKLDNRLENLEWCTYAENNQHYHDSEVAIEKRTAKHQAWLDKKEIAKRRSASTRTFYEKMKTVGDDHVDQAIKECMEVLDRFTKTI